MKRTHTYPNPLTIVILVLYFFSCKSPIKDEHTVIDNNKSVSTKNSYELADSFLNTLRDKNIDTIIFQTRTCISCCDFYNIFWASGGNYFLKKFYNIYDSQIPDTGTIKLYDDEIFGQLSENYKELQNSRINHTEPSSVHYCFTEINIYTTHDEIKTGRIYDSDFRKNDGYMNAKNDRERNEKYLANFESRWNDLLITIESQLAIMHATKERELKALRIKK